MGTRIAFDEQKKRSFFIVTKDFSQIRFALDLVLSKAGSGSMFNIHVAI